MVSRISFKLSGFEYVVLGLTIAGILLGTLPDTSPDLVASIPPFNRHYSALTTLSQLRYRNSDSIPIGALESPDTGYREIYGLLRQIRPSIPPLSEVQAASTAPDAGAIILHTEIGWEKAGAKLPVLQPVQLILPNGQAEPVCMFSDLSSRVQQAALRWWSRIGLVLAVCALLLEKCLKERGKK